MFNRDLRGSDTWCGLHNVVVFVMAGVMLMAAEVSAARVSNSFVTVEGDGVYVCDDGRIAFSAGPERTVTATARSGWRVNGRDSVSFKTSPGVFMTLEMTCATGEGSETVDCEEDPEDECEWEEYYETTHVEGTRCAVKVTVDPERQAVMYAVPENGTNVSVSADYEVVAKAKHETYRRWRCVKHQNCDKTHDPEKEFVESFDVEPDTFAWTATGTNGTVRSSAWSGFLSKGIDQAVAFELKASKSGCGDPGCRCEASEKAYVDVYELSIDFPDEYLGLDMTDAMKEEYVTREATATIDPAPASATYSWKGCGRCVFMGDTDKSKVTYGGCDKTGGSDSYLAEKLTVAATAKNATGQEASATCTTNFTVVAVNVSVGGAGEDGEESTPQNVMYSRELTKFAIANMTPVKVTCEPKSLSGTELVWLTLPDNVELFELGNDGTAKSAKSYYRYNEIAGKNFGLLGCPSSAEIAEGSAPEFKKGYALAEHYASGANDKGAFKVVPPPELQVTVNFSSPSGKWSYDPVWDNPAYSNTVDGSLAEWCAGHPGEAKVVYMLIRDAAEIEGKIYKKDFPRDVVISPFKCLTSAGVHVSKWSLPKNLDEGNYYAKVVAVEGETGAERSVESNEGELARGDYCYAPNMKTPVDCISIGKIAVSERKRIATERFVVVEIMGIAAGEIAESVFRFLKVSSKVSSIASMATSEAISYQFTVNSDFGEMPDWLRGDVSIYDGSWAVARYCWNATERNYVVAEDSPSQEIVCLPGGLPVVVKTTIRSGSFDIGYKCYTRMETANKDYDPKEDERQKVEIVKNKGFYSSEYESVGIAEIVESVLCGDNMQGWVWKKKPYGLLEPDKKFSSGSSN